MGTQFIEIKLDTTNVQEMMDAMSANMNEQKFENAMAGIYRRTANLVKTTMGKEVPKEYAVKARDAKAPVQSAKISGMQCVVPIESERQKIGKNGGSKIFKATGGIRGWDTLKYRRKKPRIGAHIYRGGRSTLPLVMSSYGGQPPFINTAAGKLNNLVFTRVGKKRFPIRRVAGIAVPQMPANKSLQDVQDELQRRFEKEVERRFSAMLRIGR